ncbi:hypothetical protein BH23GEM2_BH23GEM2_23430 [soil metagenome]
MTRLQRAAFRKRRNYLFALAAEAVAIPLEIVARLATATPKEPASWRRGLIIAHSHIGDVLYRTASLPVLSDAFPRCEWTFLTSREGAEVLRGNPHLHDTVAAIRGEDSWQLEPGAAAALRRRKFHVAVCTNTLRYAPDLLLAVRLGIPSRAGPALKGLSGLLTHPLEVPFPSPFPAYSRALVAQLAGREPSWSLRPLMYPAPEDVECAHAAWQALGLGARPVIACAPATRQPAGAWPVSTFAAILRAVATKYDLVFLGGAGDAAQLRAAAEQTGVRPRILAGVLNVRAAAAVLHRCAALLSQDSGPRHIGNVAGIPVAFLRNVAVNPVETGRYLATELDLAPASVALDAHAASELVRREPAEQLATRFTDFVITSAPDGSPDTSLAPDHR